MRTAISLCRWSGKPVRSQSLLRGPLAANWIPENPAHITGEPWDWAAALGVVVFAAGWITVGQALWGEEAETLQASLSA